MVTRLPNTALTLDKGAELGRFNMGSTVILLFEPNRARWHPLLLAWEVNRPATQSAADHEAAWPTNAAMRSELAAVQTILRSYADLLGTVAGVPSLAP